MRRAYPSISSPARVGVAPRPRRSSSCTPSSSSSARMCSEIVGCVRKSASAAREKLPSSATFAKISRRRRSIRASREWWDDSVAGATAAAAPAAARHPGRHVGGERAGGLEAEHGQLPHHLIAGARRAGDDGRGTGDVLLELRLALLATVFVDRHLLAAALHVALHELLGILLEDVVDLVEELVDVFLDLLALLGQLRARSRSVSTFRGLGRPDFFLLLLCHLALHGATGRVARYPRPLLAGILTRRHSHAFEVLAEGQGLPLVGGAHPGPIDPLGTRAQPLEQDL